MVICPECESTNNEPDEIEGLPTPSNAQIWLCMDCLTTFYTTQSVSLSAKLNATVSTQLTLTTK